MQALDQAQSGKGKERHADGESFLNQPICKIGRRKGHGFTQGQVWKKILEVDNLPTIDAKIREMLSIIVYAAADILLLEEEQSAAWEVDEATQIPDFTAQMDVSDVIRQAEKDVKTIINVRTLED
jgi:hypothetical protein